LIKEVLYPLTDMALVLALIVFLLLEILAEAAGLLGIWLVIVIVPAYFRYLLHLLEARANGRNAPSPGIELFNWVENFWSLFPLVLVSLLIWGEYYLISKFPFTVAAIPGVIVLYLYPASMAVLAVTRSPLESLNPATLLVLIRNCGRDYLLIPLVIVTMSFLVWTLDVSNVSHLLTKAVALYASFLMFTLTGAVLSANGAGISVDIPPPREPDAEQLDADLTQERTRVLNHAYGFVSHENRQGGLQHIYDCIEQEADAAAAYRWFFEQMLKWESTDAALFFAQNYLSWLLARRRDVEVLKVIARCRLENERFMPVPEDRDAVLAAADRQDNDEIREYLRR
jgi:hypothetical protein